MGHFFWVTLYIPWVCCASGNQQKRSIGGILQVDSAAKEQLLRVLTTSASKPSLQVLVGKDHFQPFNQVVRFNGRWFALNSSLLVLYRCLFRHTGLGGPYTSSIQILFFFFRILSSRGHMALIPVHQVKILVMASERQISPKYSRFHNINIARIANAVQCHN